MSRTGQNDMNFNGRASGSSVEGLVDHRKLMRSCPVGNMLGGALGCFPSPSSPSVLR